MRTANIEFAPTENCNLACKYCYVNRTTSKMTIETADSFFNHIDGFLKLYNCDSYNISYFGGEPTLNWPIIKHTIGKFKKDARCGHTVLISNLLNVTEDDHDFMQSNNLDVSWSFDGLWNDGDNRPLVSGKSSLPIYLKKIDLLKKISRNNVKVMVGPQNVSSLCDNLKFFVEKLEISNPDFSLIRDDIWDQGSIDEFKIEIVKLADLQMEYLKQGLFSFGFFSLPILDMFAGANFGKRGFSCFAGCNGGAYLPDGIFYPCMRFGSAREFPLLNANTGEVYRNNVNTLLNPLFHNPQTFNKCKYCSLYHYCNSGCHYSQINKDNGTITGVPLDSLCQLFKLIYRQTFRIVDTLKTNKNFQKTLYNYLKNIFGRY